MGSSYFNPGDPVVYLKGEKSQPIKGKILHITATGRFRVELENGAHVTVAYYSLKKPDTSRGEP